jgi:hypothetical protein
MNLTLDELMPYLGGWLEIKRINKYNLQGGIKTLTISDGHVLRIEFIWKMQFEGWPIKNSRWIHVPELVDYIVDLGVCRVPDWMTVKGKTISFYLAAADEQITLHLANDESPIKPLDVEGCPESLEFELESMKEKFLSMLNLSKIPRSNVEVAQIPAEASSSSSKFMRVDLKWQDISWSFVRMQKNPEDNHCLIYYRLINEIAEQFSLTSRDIGDLVFDRGGGYLQRSGENSIRVWGSSSYFRGEPNHELTRNILREELLCQVD